MLSGSKPWIEQDEQEKRQSHHTERHGNSEILIMGTKTEFLFQRRLDIFIGLGKGLWHIARAHPKPRMLLDEMQRSPCKFDTL